MLFHPEVSPFMVMGSLANLRYSANAKEGLLLKSYPVTLEEILELFFLFSPGHPLLFQV